MHNHLRLKKRNEYQTVYRVKNTAANMQFVVFFRKNRQTEQFRLGISVSKKNGNAVIRNRLRRCIKEIVRLHKDEITPNLDFIVVTRKGVESFDYHQLESSLIHVLKRAKIIAAPQKSSGNQKRS
jgi:ribonuclease P protein component